MARYRSWNTTDCGGSKIVGILALILLVFGVQYSEQDKVVSGVDIRLKNPNDGYFLKFQHHSPQTQQESLIITEPTGELPVVQAQLGPFFSEKPIPRHLLDTSTYNDSNILDRFTMDGRDISVHLVSSKITPDSPMLQILIHAGMMNYGNGGNDRGDSGGVGGSSSGKQTALLLSTFPSRRRWCGQVFVQHLDDELTAACLLNDKYNGCVAGVEVPEEWWVSPNKTTVTVYYTVTGINKNEECGNPAYVSGAALQINASDAAAEIVTENRRYLTTLSLSSNEEEYKDIEEKHVIISVPTATYRPGSLFYVPIKLEADSDVQVFVIRARTKNGLRILGASNLADSPWQITVDVSERQKSATVTATLTDTGSNLERVWPQEIFKWKLQVDNNLSGFEVGRIIWSVEYEVDGKAREHHFIPNKNFLTKINIQSVEEKKLVPVLKVTEIMNVASLTGRTQIYPLQIFVVNKEGSIHDVTWLTSCHSSNDNVLKVSRNCSFIYVDGKEKIGSRNVTVIAKSRQLVAFTHVTVWMPDERLNIQLSDNKLSQIKRWKVTKDRILLRRKKRDKILGMDDPTRNMCRLRYQQSTVDVYASFCVLENGRLQYYTGKKTYFRVTEMLKDRLRLSDSHIASLSGNIIMGKNPGLTEIQVLSPTSRVMAAKEIRVGQDKVAIQRLLINTVTDISLEIREAALNDPTTILAVVHVNNQLKTKFQEALLDIAVQFTDKTVVPLKYISPLDYKLEISSLNRQVLKIPRPFGLPYQPTVIATGPGEGQLNISLRLGHRCFKKNMLPLVSKTLHMNIEFTNERSYLDKLQRDSHYDNRASRFDNRVNRYDNRASDRWNQKSSPQTSFSVPTIDISAQDNKIYYENIKSGIKQIPKVADHRQLQYKEQQNQQQHLQQDFLIDNNNNIDGMRPKSAPQLQQVVKAPELSALEIVMYVLLAVFCMAIIVFTVNCVVFTVRYRRKQMPKDMCGGTEPVSSARDWVWVGQATLERNAVNTRCSQTLMPEEDFNGNQMRARLYSGTESTRSAGSASANSSAATSAGGGSGSGSNRNSTVSTYMGSECSIRITANPMPAEGATGAAGVSTDSHSNHHNAPPEWDYEAMGLTYEQFRDYLDNLKESTA
ncbi:transmembrane protein 132E [Octopus bimaculoides]|uniref:transmembrane protein 132E n=1 Tax=Octopus bimaculoides TaxID=37653 RepID=UPI00071D0392|nr:transmembrane protein 132E [Octopus bimaculoides]|eukprot:XP_014784675.1 PREDICTED: transmembrane protein 132E-like [Octopus bimaculoides]